MLAVGDRVGFHGSDLTWTVKDTGASTHASSKVLLRDETTGRERWIERAIITPGAP